MILKKKKFQTGKQVFNLLSNPKPESIYLITHLSNLSIMESHILNEIYKANSVIDKYYKINLFRKLTKNKLILNLFLGPTKLFIFSNFNTFLTFEFNKYYTKKIIPLMIYYNNNLYSYDFFVNRIKELFNIPNLNKSVILTNFIGNITKTNIMFLTQTTFVLTKFLSFLSILKLKINNNK